MAEMFTGLEVDIELPAPEKRQRGLLLEAARTIPESQLTRNGTNRVQAGVVWKPWGELELLDGAAVGCDVVYDKQPRDLPDNITQHAFLLWNSLTCGNLSGWADVLAGRVEVNMDLLRSAAFAHELETGSLATSGHGLVGSVAYPPTIVTSSASSLLTSITLLEDHFASVQPGARGTIHLTPGLLVAALAGGIVEWRDGQYRTATDTNVVGDAGHLGQATPQGGSAPGDGEAWIYISGDIWVAQLQPRRPAATADGLGEVVLLRNEDRVLSEMWGLITFDPNLIGAALVSTAGAAAAGGGDASAANQAAGNALLTDIETGVDGLETLIDSTNTKLDALTTAIGDLDVNQEAMETLLTAISNFFNTASTNATSAALVNTAVVKASAGTVYGISGYADAAGFVTIHNKASAPANTDVPVLAIPVESGKAWSVDFGLRGRAFSTGVSLGFSSTGPTFTSGAGSHTTYDAQYT